WPTGCGLSVATGPPGRFPAGRRGARESSVRQSRGDLAAKRQETCLLVLWIFPGLFGVDFLLSFNWPPVERHVTVVDFQSQDRQGSDHQPAADVGVEVPHGRPATDFVLVTRGYVSI